MNRTLRLGAVAAWIGGMVGSPASLDFVADQESVDAVAADSAIRGGSGIRTGGTN